MTRGTRLTRIAGALLFMAGFGIFMGIITAEALYPGEYTTGGSMISDLGGTEPPDSVVLQPSAAIFDTTMIVIGLLVLAAAACLYVARRKSSLIIPMALLGIGAVGVGIFPGDTGAVHQLFAQLTFISGGVAAILTYRSVSGPFLYVTVALGAITLVNLGAYIIFGDGWFVAGLGLGGLERWIAYPVIFWLIGLGGYLMAARGDDHAHPGTS
jgi:hypothetical membrane protein